MEVIIDPNHIGVKYTSMLLGVGYFKHCLYFAFPIGKNMQCLYCALPIGKNVFLFLFLFYSYL